ncbi:VOC family protein [Vibrio sp.]|nr:VOC family protein [Vibrio sp.]
MTIPVQEFDGMKPQQLISDIDGFMVAIERMLSELSLDLSEFELDHIALRINEPSLAHMLLPEWQSISTVLSDAEINGRPIYIFKLNQPLKLSHWCTACVEYPFPKNGKPYPFQGWEHVEFVVPSQATNAQDYLLELYQRFPDMESRVENLSKEGLTVKLSQPKGEKERLPNPTVAFKWKDVCVKLHPNSIEQIILSESI